MATRRSQTNSDEESAFELIGTNEDVEKPFQALGDEKHPEGCNCGGTTVVATMRILDDEPRDEMSEEGEEEACCAEPHKGGVHHTFDLGMALMEEFSRQEELARAAEEKEKEEEKKRDRKTIANLVELMRDQEQSRWAEMAKKDEEIASLNELFEKSSREKEEMCDRIADLCNTMGALNTEITQLQKKNKKYRLMNSTLLSELLNNEDGLLKKDRTSKEMLAAAIADRKKAAKKEKKRLEREREAKNPRTVTLTKGDTGFFGLFFSGTSVSKVRPGSSAEVQGVRRGDEILSINGTPVTKDNISLLARRVNNDDSMVLVLRYNPNLLRESENGIKTIVKSVFIINILLMIIAVIMKFYWHQTYSDSA
ncbi:hypothetical protein PRIPAC_92631 [Pristionchus pacificus]|uniref:PDZ domain-containing protein n=1 Tax=Pristionchus pacificus TaxID=54126 RepID=A0A2A6BBD3_PRIPA|nr:hypothetical protein PRIPAC_92631 [Pristionchus pacificus]|eukprot:PDM63188.1 PDZ domain-containing protein [Pristionchus pacificus]